MKGAAPSIERSTWLSAARCSTASGWKPRKMSSIASRLPMSTLKWVWRLLSRASGDQDFHGVVLRHVPLKGNHVIAGGAPLEWRAPSTSVVQDLAEEELG